MEIVRKSFKAYILAICAFALLTLVLAALLQLTSYREDWSFGGLIAALCISTLFLGVMEGHLTGKKGMPVGLLSAVIFIFIVLLAVNGIFAGGLLKDCFNILYLIPALSGAVGGIIGANSRKS